MGLASFLYALSSLATAAVDGQALEQLRAAAEQSDSSALIVVQHGSVLGEWYFDGPARPIETQSITKSVTALVIGTLVGSASLPTLDTPVHTFFPEWNQGKKKLVTVRHLLTHTSCLQDVPSSADEIALAHDAVRLALVAELMCVPGKEFHYSNKATNLLAGIVEKITGRRLDEVAREALFAPLDIREVIWCRDPAGNPFGMGGLQMKLRDLAKLGELVANRGRWQDVQVVPEAWVEALQTPGTAAYRDYGLLWWLARPPWYRRMFTFKAPDAVVARGWLGQYLWVVPSQQLVVARLYDIARGTDRSSVAFERFEELALRLIGR